LGKLSLTTSVADGFRGKEIRKTIPLYFCISVLSYINFMEILSLCSGMVKIVIMPIGLCVFA
jgi:hypothetical protein